MTLPRLRPKWWQVLISTALLFPAAIADDFEIPYDLASGTFTHYWADFSNPPNAVAMIYSFFLPYVNLLGPSVYFVIWGGIVTGAYLYTQDVTMPLIVGTLTGAIMASLMTTPEAQIMMGLVISFFIGGVIVKVILGK